MGTTGNFLGFVALTVATAYFWRRYADVPIVIDRKSLSEGYDYIVVGAGSAGAAVAGRLSEDDGVTVALLEAGPASYAHAHKPSNYLTLQRSSIDWSFLTEPQEKACLGLNDKDVRQVLAPPIYHMFQKSRWPRGKVLGGTSMINGLMFMRGSRGDFDQWEAMGCDGWSYKHVLPYFIKSENTNNEEYLLSGYHGGDGPLYLSDAVETLELKHAFIRASQELGMKPVDPNGKESLGVHFSGFQRTTHKGIRWSTAHAFLYSNLHRENLHVLTEAQVTKVLLDGTKAIGVEYLKDGKHFQVKARKEVILSAGAVMSPHILMHSGIGPKEELEKYGIQVVADLPVGKSLQDHINVDSPSFTLPYPVSFTPDRINSWLSTIKYELFGTGLQSTVGTEATCFFKTPLQDDDDVRPFIQILQYSMLNGASPEYYDGIIDAYNFKPEIFRALHGMEANLHGVTFLPTLLHPRSEGRIFLGSANPLDPPKIDPNYLDHSQDVENLLFAIRTSLSYANTSAFKEAGLELIIKPHPDCESLGFDSDAYWRCYIRQMTFTIYHPVGTCRMGAKSDPKAVVDPQLRVKGIEGLRVIDASVMPTLTSGNTHAPTVMIGEKGADLVKGKTLPPMPDH